MSMKLLLVNHKEVRELLGMEACIEVVESALRVLAEGRGDQPLRTAMRLSSGKGMFGLMPAYLGDIDMHAVKAVSVFPGNHGTAYDAHQGVVVLYEGEHGCPIAVMDGSEITAIRTAAASALATRLLAREDARTLALIGSGIQARTHLEAICCVREIESVRVWSKTAERAQAFVDQARDDSELEFKVCDDAAEALHRADIICTTTSAKEAIIRGEWLFPGTHVNAVGACVPHAREFDSAALARSLLFTDRRESLHNEAGDFLLAKQEGAIGEDHLQGEIGDLLLGRVEGRKDEADITFFKSLGIGVEDLAAARYINDQARLQGIGSLLDFSEAPDGND